MNTAPKETAPAHGPRCATAEENTGDSNDIIALTAATEPRVDSRIIARHLGGQHRSTVRLVIEHQPDFARLGKVRFEIAPSGGGSGQRERYALLNEDQCYLLLTYTRNTKRTRELKVNLVLAFREARQRADVHRAEYLPSYRNLHEQVAALASDSPHARQVHININKAINRAVGIASGQREGLPLVQQSRLAVAQSVAAGAMSTAHDHHDGYRLAKEALERLAYALEVLP